MTKTGLDCQTRNTFASILAEGGPDAVHNMIVYLYRSPYLVDCQQNDDGAESVVLRVLHDALSGALLEPEIPIETIPVDQIDVSGWKLTDLKLWD